MKKLFTYLLASAAFCLMGTVNVMADDGTDLTKEMFKNYTNEANPTDASEGCSYVLNELTDLPYGDGLVGWKLYAELSDYDYLQVVLSEKEGAEAIVRPFINRLEDNQQAGEEFDKTKPVDFNKQWAQERYWQVSDDALIYTFDLKKIRGDYGFVRLHCIKSGGGWPTKKVKVSSMKLYKGSAPTAINNVAVESAADAQLYNAAGQKVGKNYKGLVMQKNGKKWMQK